VSVGVGAWEQQGMVGEWCSCSGGHVHVKLTPLPYLSRKVVVMWEGGGSCMPAEDCVTSSGHSNPPSSRTHTRTQGLCNTDFWLLLLHHPLPIDLTVMITFWCQTRAMFSPPSSYPRSSPPPPPTYPPSATSPLVSLIDTQQHLEFLSAQSLCQQAPAEGPSLPLHNALPYFVNTPNHATRGVVEFSV